MKPIISFAFYPAKGGVVDNFFRDQHGEAGLLIIGSSICITSSTNTVGASRVQKQITLTPFLPELFRNSTCSSAVNKLLGAAVPDIAKLSCSSRNDSSNIAHSSSVSRAFYHVHVKLSEYRAASGSAMPASLLKPHQQRLVLFRCSTAYQPLHDVSPG